MDYKDAKHISVVNENANKSPLLSIITPVYNEIDYLRRMVRSVQEQSFNDWELILIDDHSNEETKKLEKVLCKEEPRIRLINNEQKGVSSARNLGLSNANGKYITFLDADDFLYDNALLYRVQALENNPDIQGVYCVAEITDKNGKKLGWQMGTQKKATFEDMYTSIIHMNAILGRAELMRSVQFETNLTNGEDWLYISDLLRSGCTFYQIENCAVAYCINQGSTVCQNYKKHEDALVKIIDLLYSKREVLKNIAPKYLNGLSEPPKEITLLRRRRGLLIWLLLDKNINEVIKVANEIYKFSDAKIELGQSKGIIVFQVLRYYTSKGIPVNEGIDRDMDDIANCVTQIADIFPDFARLFITILQDIHEFGYNTVRYNIKGVKEGAYYLLYGTGSMSEKVTKNVEALGGKIAYYSDSNKDKWNNYFMDKLIIPPHSIPEYREKFDKVIIASSFTSEILSKLEEIGLGREKDIIIVD